MQRVLKGFPRMLIAGIFLSFVVSVSLFLAVLPVSAAVVTWDGGGATNDWSDCTNWSGNACPASTDTATFDATSTKNVTIDAGFGGTIGTLNLSAGYTGTMTQARSLTVTAGFNVNSGTFQADSNSISAGDLTVAGGTFNHSSGTLAIGTSNCSANNFTVSSGTFSGGSGSITVSTTCEDSVVVSGGTLTSTSGILSANDLEWTAGTFTHNSGTLTLTGAASTINLPTTGTLYNVTLNKTDGVNQTIVSAGDTLTIAGTFTLTNGKLNTGGGTVNVQGDLTYGAGYDGVGTNIVTLLINGSGAQAINYASAAATIERFTLNNANATVTGIASGSVTIKKVTVQAGTWNLGNGNTTITEGLYISGGTMNHGSGALVVADDACSGDRDFSVTGGAFVGGSGAMTWNGNCGGHTFDISGSGAFTSTSGTFTIDYDVAITGGTFTHNSGTVLIDGASSALNVDTTITFSAFTLSKNGGATLTLSAGDTVVTAGTLTLTDGLFSGGTTIDAQGNVTVGAAFDGGTTPLKFSGSGTQTFDLTGATASFNTDITVNKSGGAVNLASTLTMDASGQDLVIQEGTFDVSGNTLSVTGAGTETLIIETGGNLQLQGGETITGDSASYPQLDSGSTVTYDGTSGPYTLKNYTYHHLTINGGASSVFTLAANESFGGNVTITQGILSQGGFTLTVTGTFSNLGTLRRLQTEVFTGTMDVDSGTVEYVGDGDGSVEDITVTDFGGAGTDYYNLKINDTNGTKDTFTVGGGLTLAGTLQVTSSTFSQGSNAMTPAAITVDGGTLTGGSAAITVSGVVTISAGTFTSTSNTLQVSGGWTHTAGGTFTHNSGTVTFAGSSATVDVSINETFSALTVNKTGGQTLTIASGDTLIAVGTLTLTDGLVDTGTLEAQAGVTVASTYDGGTAPLTFSGGNAQTFTLTGGEGAFNADITVAKSGNGVTLASALTMDAAGQDLTVTTGTFNTSAVGNYGLTVAGNFSVNGSTVSVNTSTVAVTGTLRLNGGNLTATGGSNTVTGTLQVSSGTYTQAGQTLTVGALTVDGGTFTGGSGTVTSSGAVTISSGTLTAPSGTLNADAGWTHTAGGSFAHNSGTIVFRSSSATVDVAVSETFSALTVNKTGGQTLTIASGDTLIAVGTLTLTDGLVDTGTLEAQAGVTVASTYDGGTAPLTFSGGNAQTFDLTGATDKWNGNITVNKSGDTVTLGSALVLDSTGDFTLTSGTFSTGNNAVTTSAGADIAVNGGTFNVGSSTMTVAGALTVAGGTYNGNTSTGTFSGAFTISSGNYNGNTSTPTFSGGLTISGGTFTASSGTTTVSGTWTHTAGGTFTHNSGTVTFTGNDATINVATNETFSVLTVNKTGGQTLTIASGDSLIATGTITLTDGAVATGTLEAQGNVTVGAAFDGGSAALKFSGGAAQSFDLTGATNTFNGDIEVAKSADTVSLASNLVMDAAGQDLTVTSGTFSANTRNLTVAGNVAANGGVLTLSTGTIDLNGNLSVGGGTLNLSTATLAGNATYTSGTISEGTSTITMDGTSQTVSGAFRFYNLTKTVTSAATLTFPASTTVAITGTPTFAGASGQLLSLRSSANGTTATLSVTTAATPGTYQYLDIMDSTVVGPQLNCLTTTYGCVDSGNNSGWKFRNTGSTTASNVGTGGSASTVGSAVPPTTVGGLAELLAPSLTLLAPNGGETYAAGETVNVIWKTENGVRLVHVLVSYDGGTSWEMLASTIPNYDVYTWRIPDNNVTDEALIAVQGTDLAAVTTQDWSNDTFGITRNGEADAETAESAAATPDAVSAVAARLAALPETVDVHGLVKLQDDGDVTTFADAAVYYVGADGKRHAFPNEAIYKTWYCDFDDVVVLSAVDMAAIELGANVTYRPGVRMVKFITVPKVYAVDRYGVLHWITSESVAWELYGNAWNTKIDDLSDALYRNYTFGMNIDDADGYDPSFAATAVVHPSDSIIIPGYSSTGALGAMICEE